MELRGYRVDYTYVLRPDLNYDQGINVKQIFLEGKNGFDDFMKFRQEKDIYQTRRSFSTVYIDQVKGRQVIVIFLESLPGKEVNVDNYKIVQSFIDQQKFHHYILISENGLNSSVMNNTKYPNYNFELFEDWQLAVDPRSFCYGPIQILHIPSQQVASWAEREQIPNPRNLPFYVSSDPMSKIHGAQATDVFQEMRIGFRVQQVGWASMVRENKS
jgi:hypothetical protein